LLRTVASSNVPIAKLLVQHFTLHCPQPWNTQMTKLTMQQVSLIDDDEAVRDAMGMLLESSGISYRSFASAYDFVADYDNTCVVA
jgi:hypothetical protein